MKNRADQSSQVQVTQNKKHYQPESSRVTRKGHNRMSPSARRPLKDYFAFKTDNPMAEAFEKKASVHAGVGIQPVDEREKETVIKHLCDTRRQETSVAYIHIPFCENHCLFCGFYQNKYKQDRAEIYSELLIKELAMFRDSHWQDSQPLRAVYFGGGTPSALSAKSLAGLLEAVQKNLPLAEDCEITIEGRVKNFDDEKIAACLDAGANRISIGIQSFDDDLRRSQGRRSSSHEALQFIQKLVVTDRAAIVLDLLYGLPDQSLKSWQQDLNICMDSGINGLDLYALTLIPGSPLARKIELGKSAVAADIQKQTEFYALGLESLRNAQWQQLSTCHFSHDTRERNLYNLLVKGGVSCMPFGSGAGGTHAGFGFRLEHDLERYQQRIVAGEKPVSMLYRQSENHQKLSQIGAEMERGFLRLGHLRESLDRQLSEKNWQDLFILLQQYQKAGLIDLEQKWLRLTDAGRYWQVTITQNLIEWMGPRLSTITTEEAFYDTHNR